MLIIENLSIRSRIQKQYEQFTDGRQPSHGTSKASGLPLSTGTLMTESIDVWRDESELKLENPQTEEEEKRLIKLEEDDVVSDKSYPDEEITESNSDNSKKGRRIRVCTIALNPRQGSLFRTNLLGEVGSGKYKYFVKSDCPWDQRRIRLISYVKCCESLAKVTRSINAAVTEFDVVVVTGDEYCYVTEARSQFRQYYGTQIISKAKNVTVIDNYKPIKEMMDEPNGVRYPLYIPLGPREEFLQMRIDPNKDIVPPSKRLYLYNFLGSMTSWSRQVLKRVVARDLATPENQAKYPSFVHITDSWHLKVTKQNGYVEPDEYRKVLLNSVFTLCPTGHNPEAYRIFEALEAGSIPILAIDPWYEKARCNDAFRPYREAGAPFIYLNGGWKQLQYFLEKRGTNATWIHERHLACVSWYKKYMRATALRFEAVLEHRFNKRMQRKQADVIKERDELLGEQEEIEAVEKEEEEDEKMERAFGRG